jgi:hypothetical protein
MESVRGSRLGWITTVRSHWFGWPGRCENVVYPEIIFAEK